MAKTKAGSPFSVGVLGSIPRLMRLPTTETWSKTMALKKSSNAPALDIENPIKTYRYINILKLILNLKHR
jgi:hypothetical protein